MEGGKLLNDTLYSVNNEITSEFEPTKAPFPWRRYFARSIDLGLSSTVFTLILILIFKTDLSELGLISSILSVYVPWIIMFLLEPVLISKWGKTPGKWVFGISIHNKDGCLLTRKQAFDRLLLVFKKGSGYAIPFYDIYCYYKHYKICKETGVLPWDKSYRYDVKPFCWYQAAGYIVITLVSTLLTTGIGFTLFSAPNRTMLTTDMFIENYNYFIKQYDLNITPLEEDKTWYTTDERLKKEGHFMLERNPLTESPTFTNDPMGMMSSFSYTIKNTEGTSVEYAYENSWLTAALLSSNTKLSIIELAKYEGMVIELTDGKASSVIPVPSVVDYMDEHPFDSYMIDVENIRITQTTEYTGYEYYETAPEMLYPDKSADEHFFKQTFKLEQGYGPFNTFD